MSSTNVSWQQKAAARRTNAGNRPLHASGVSILAMASIAYRKTLELDGPLGSTWRRIANLAEPANPIIYAVQCQWLAILSFLDDQILAGQKIIEALFTPSSHLFVNNDDVVLVIMSLPEKFDDALTKLPEIIHHEFPALECVLLYLISWLNCLVSVFHYSERIDNDESNVSTSESSEPSEAAASKRAAAMAVSTQKRSSYKEALMNDDEDEGVNANVQKRGSYKEALMHNDEDEGVNASVQKKGSYKEALMNDEDEGVNAGVHVNDEVGRSGRSMKEDDHIMGLFESSGWTI